MWVVCLRRKTTEVKCNSHHSIPRAHTIDGIYHSWCWLTLTTWLRECLSGIATVPLFFFFFPTFILFGSRENIFLNLWLIKGIKVLLDTSITLTQQTKIPGYWIYLRRFLWQHLLWWTSRVVTCSHLSWYMDAINAYS